MVIRPLPFVLVLIFSCQLHAQTTAVRTREETAPPGGSNQNTSKSIAESKNELSQIGADMKIKTVALLKLIKAMETVSPVANVGIAKVIRAQAAVRETETPESSILFQADIEDELPVVDKREHVYRVRLEDGRTGWIHERDVQILTRSAEKKPPSDTKMLFTVAVRIMQDIREQHARAGTVITLLHKTYIALSSDEQQKYRPEYQAAVRIGKTIEQYHGYASRFFSPYAPYAERSLPPTAARPDKTALNGQISLDIGQSAYESAKENSESSRNLQANATWILNNTSRLVANLGHRREVMQTPFTTTDVLLGYSRQLKNSMRLNSRLGYLHYDDQNLNRNDFGQLQADVQMEYGLTGGARLSGAFSHIRKSFRQSGGNDFVSNQFNLNTIFKNGNKSETAYNLRGILQSSDISFLHFNQITPRMRYLLRRSPQSNFSVVTEVDYIGYTKEARNNSYVKESADFQWTTNAIGGEKTRIARLAFKQFPNNNQFNYLRAGGDLSWRTGTAGIGTSTSVYALFNWFTSNGKSQTDFLDLRLDRNGVEKTYFVDASLFNRLWTQVDPKQQQNHLLDLYSRAGPVFSGTRLGSVLVNRLKVGLILGGHVLYGSGGNFIKKDGNSLRFGLGFDASAAWKQTTGTFSGSFEKSVVYGNEIEINPWTGQMEIGKVVPRSPVSIQFRCDTRTPVGRDWDIRFNLSYYNIRPDVNDKTSINPLERRTKFKLFLGLVHRFDW